MQERKMKIFMVRIARKNTQEAEKENIGETEAVQREKWTTDYGALKNIDKALLQDERRAFERRSKLSQLPPRPRATTIADINIETLNTMGQEGDRKISRQETPKEEKKSSYVYRSTH
ncbi:hypothetical protein ILUMI_00933 [Ignelater luminosus]|uniref:Uncharacterized protein n=1 Tax=Ignelater luminosus TaxID=2038154 RepID=A0A8K0DG99_IGNLU|nr:hypothetical protein ILUMI_00933 [Ignelater luminosus]